MGVANLLRMTKVEEWNPYFVSILEAKAGEEVRLFEVRYERCVQVNKCLYGGDGEQVVLGQTMNASLRLSVGTLLRGVQKNPVKCVEELRLRGGQLVEGTFTSSVQKSSTTVHHMRQCGDYHTPPEEEDLDGK